MSQLKDFGTREAVGPFKKSVAPKGAEQPVNKPGKSNWQKALHTLSQISAVATSTATTAGSAVSLGVNNLIGDEQEANVAREQLGWGRWAGDIKEGKSLSGQMKDLNESKRKYGKDASALSGALSGESGPLVEIPDFVPFAGGAKVPILAFAGDIASDPLTYLAPGASLKGVGGVKGAARIAADGSEAYKVAAGLSHAAGNVEQAASAAAKAEKLSKVAAKLERSGIGSLHAEEVAALSDHLVQAGKIAPGEALRGLHFNTPGTGRIGRAVQNPVREALGFEKLGATKQVLLSDSALTRAPGRLMKTFGSELRNTAVGGRVAEHLGGKHPEWQALLRSGDPVMSRQARVALDAEALSQGAGRALKSDLLGRIGPVVKEARKLVDDATIMRALQGDVAAINKIPTEIMTALRGGLDSAVTRANELSRAAKNGQTFGEDFLVNAGVRRPDYFPRVLNPELREEAKTVLTREFGSLSAAEHESVKIGDTFLGRVMEDPRATGRTLEDQMQAAFDEHMAVTGQKTQNLFEQDLGKSLEKYINGVANRVTEKRFLNQLDANGMLAEASVEQVTAKSLKANKNYQKLQEAADKLTVNVELLKAQANEAAANYVSAVGRYGEGEALAKVVEKLDPTIAEHAEKMRRVEAQIRDLEWTQNALAEHLVRQQEVVADRVRRVAAIEDNIAAGEAELERIGSKMSAIEKQARAAVRGRTEELTGLQRRFEGLSRKLEQLRAEPERVAQLRSEIAASQVEIPGVGVRYHGTANAFDEAGRIAEGGGISENLFGPGLYTTSEAQVATEYTLKGARAGGNPTVYGLEWTAPTPPRVLDLNAPLPADLHSAFNLPDWVDTTASAEAALRSSISAGAGRDAYAAFKNALAEGGVTRDVADEVLQGLNDRLRLAGYDGMSHTGGLGVRGASTQHDVTIWLGDAVNNIKVTALGTELVGADRALTEYANLYAKGIVKTPPPQVAGIASAQFDTAQREFARLSDELSGLAEDLALAPRGSRERRLVGQAMDRVRDQIKKLNLSEHSTNMQALSDAGVIEMGDDYLKALASATGDLKAIDDKLSMFSDAEKALAAGDTKAAKKLVGERLTSNGYWPLDTARRKQAAELGVLDVEHEHMLSEIEGASQELAATQSELNRLAQAGGNPEKLALQSKLASMDLAHVTAIKYRDSLIRNAAAQAELDIAELRVQWTRAEKAAQKAEAIAAKGQAKVTKAWPKGVPPTEKELIEAIRPGWEKFAASYQAPEFVVDGIAKVGARFNPVDGSGLDGFLKFYDKVQGIVKSGQTLTPGFHFRNYFGGTFNNWLAGVDEISARTFAKNLKAFEAGGINAIKDPKIADAFKRMEDLGILDSGISINSIEHSVLGGQGLTQAINPANKEFKLYQLSRSVGNSVENRLRGQLAMDRILKGFADEDVIADVAKYHFDYADLSNFEQKVVRRVIPFYTWTRRNLPLQVEGFLTQPYKYKAYAYAKQHIESLSPPEDSVPGYFNEQLGIRLPFKMNGSQAYILPDLPFKDLAVPFDATDKTLGMVTPLIKAPLEAYRKERYFNDVPFKDEYQPMPGIWQKVGLDKAAWMMSQLPGPWHDMARRGEDGRIYMKDQNQYIISQYIPLLATATRLLPSGQAQDAKNRQRLNSTMLSWAFGLGIRTNTPAEQQAEQYRNMKAQSSRDALQKQLGYR